MIMPYLCWGWTTYFPLNLIKAQMPWNSRLLTKGSKALISVEAVWRSNAAVRVPIARDLNGAFHPRYTLHFLFRIKEKQNTCVSIKKTWLRNLNSFLEGTYHSHFKKKCPYLWNGELNIRMEFVQQIHLKPNFNCLS